MTGKKKDDRPHKPTPLMATGGRKAVFEPYKAMDLWTPEEPKPTKGKFKVATAAEDAGRQVSNARNPSVTLYKRIKLYSYVQDPYTYAQKELMEAAMRRNFCVRTSFWIREHMAFRKSKIVVELPDYIKDTIPEKEQREMVKKISENPKVKAIIKKFATRDSNLKLVQNAKGLAWQLWGFGRGLIVVFYDEENQNAIQRLMLINNRRLQEPVLDEKNNLSFEGCIVDGQGLDKSSMIYGVYQPRAISPHTEEGYGYSTIEPILYTAQAHNVLVEEDINEIAKSAWLPSILLKMQVDAMTLTNKQTQINTIIDGVNPGKIIGITDDVIEQMMLDMKPDFGGIKDLVDSLEEKIYNNNHIPLFLVKSDKIANLATAKKSAQVFIEGTVADDQEMMETILREQWYDPFLREELKDSELLQLTANEDKKGSDSDVDTPEDADLPLPFHIMRRFEKPTIEDIIELAAALAPMVEKKMLSLETMHEYMGIPEETQKLQGEMEEEDKNPDMQTNSDEAGTTAKAKAGSDDGSVQRGAVSGRDPKQASQESRGS